MQIGVDMEEATAEVLAQVSKSTRITFGEACVPSELFAAIVGLLAGVAQHSRTEQTRPTPTR
ncbi:hypothetical protein ACIGW8_11815 [Streptomyces sioyaensis]|uniref:hypothetical protein n=1 Tax=Streptomyces sioyaensis TaxID=67364 RepID=UPI0037D83705